MNWDTEPEQVGPASSGGGGWLNLKEAGDYHVRLVSGYEYIGYHFDNATKKSTVCPNRVKGQDDCDLCRLMKDEKGKLYTREQINAMQKENPKLKCFYNRPNSKYVVNLLDIDDTDDNGTPKVKHCEFGFKLVELIRGFRIDPEYAFQDTPNWDMTIKRVNGVAQTDVSWQVIPARQNRELTQNEIESIDEVETPEQIVKKKHNFANSDYTAPANDPGDVDSLTQQADRELPASKRGDQEPMPKDWLETKPAGGISEKDVEDSGLGVQKENSNVDPELGF